MKEPGILSTAKPPTVESSAKPKQVSIDLNCLRVPVPGPLVFQERTEERHRVRCLNVILGWELSRLQLSVSLPTLSPVARVSLRVRRVVSGTGPFHHNGHRSPCNRCLRGLQEKEGPFLFHHPLREDAGRHGHHQYCYRYGAFLIMCLRERGQACRARVSRQPSPIFFLNYLFLCC